MRVQLLFAWIGNTDLRASRGELGDGLGPIGQAVSKRAFSHAVLISNYKKEDEKQFIEWLCTPGVYDTEIRKNWVTLFRSR